MVARDVDSWVLRFNSRQMPIFSRTVRHIREFSWSDRNAMSALTERILEDVPLTTKVLRLANSVYYKPENVRINTVHWALMRLGYNGVKTICNTSPLVEDLLRGPRRERVIRERVKALHGAIQAKSFASAQYATGIEEVFIATSLMRLGHLAFYCFGDEVADQLETCLNTPGYSRAMAEREVLGFRLHELTAALSKDWKVCDLLQASAGGGQRADSRVNHVLLGHNLAESVENGWDSPQVQRTIEAISKTLNKSIEDVRRLVHANARQAAKASRDLGLARYLDVIPLPKTEEQVESSQSPTPASSAKLIPARETVFKEDLSDLLRKGRLDINLFFSMLLEGILREAGMDRVLLATLTSDLNHIVGKYGRGWDQDEVAHFAFSRGNHVLHIFDHVLELNEAVWIDGDKEGDLLRFLTPEVKAVMRTSSFFVMPIVIKKRAVGLICADRYPSRRELDKESFASFSHIHQLAHGALSSMM